MLQALLDEGVSIRDLVRIFEALSRASPRSRKDPEELVEAVRAALGPAISAALRAGRQAAACSRSTRCSSTRSLESLRAGEHGTLPRRSTRDRPSDAGAAAVGAPPTTPRAEGSEPVLVCAARDAAGAAPAASHAAAPRLPVLVLHGARRASSSSTPIGVVNLGQPAAA